MIRRRRRSDCRTGRRSGRLVRVAWRAANGLQFGMYLREWAYRLRQLLHLRRSVAGPRCAAVRSGAGVESRSGSWPWRSPSRSSRPSPEGRQMEAGRRRESCRWRRSSDRYAWRPSGTRSWAADRMGYRRMEDERCSSPSSRCFVVTSSWATWRARCRRVERRSADRPRVPTALRSECRRPSASGSAKRASR